MNKIKKALVTAGTAGALALGFIAVPLAPANAAYPAVYVNAWYNDAPGGTWDKTCYFRVYQNWNGSYTAYEYRERNYWWGKLCERTGYAPTTWGNAFYVPWWR